MNALARASVRDALVAQTGAANPSLVRMQIKENRKLSPGEVAELVTRYKAGASIRSLGGVFGLHEQTVRAHLKRQKVALRPVRALTKEQEYEVVRLYVDEGWSLAEVASKFGVGAGAIRSALIRQAIERRPQARRRSG